jgi:hypothetical protein
MKGRSEYPLKNNCGKTDKLAYAETDVLFENKVSARKFASTHVDPFAQHHGAQGKLEGSTIENVDTQRSDEDFSGVKA